MNRTTLIAMAAALALGAVACSSDSGMSYPKTSPTATPDAVDHEVAVVDVAFEPSQLSIAAGDTVTWTWEDTAEPHNVVADPREGEHTPAFSSGTATAEPGTTFSQTFDKAGTWTYVCQVHPGMTGSIAVGSSRRGGGAAG